MGSGFLGMAVMAVGFSFVGIVDDVNFYGFGGDSFHGFSGHG